MPKHLINGPHSYENMAKMRFPGVGPYNIPQIAPETLFALPDQWIPINYLSQYNRPAALKQLAVHFFTDDYQFTRFWKTPHKYLPRLQSCGVVCSPDFSLYADMPLALQIYNHYRKHWLGAYWQLYGIRVIPTIAWSTPESYSWCFDGEPTNSIVAVSSVGCLANSANRTLFICGYEEMVRRLQPTKVIFMGQVSPEVQLLAPIIPIEPFTKKFDRMRGDI